MSSSQSQKQAISVQIRWMIRRDMPEVLRIENDSFELGRHSSSLDDAFSIALMASSSGSTSTR